MARLPRNNMGTTDVPAVTLEATVSETVASEENIPVIDETSSQDDEAKTLSPEGTNSVDEGKISTQNAPDITLAPAIAPAAPSSKLAPLVKIKAKIKHSCTIGGVPYNFEKGKVYSVPANVKSILSRANLLDPI